MRERPSSASVSVSVASAATAAAAASTPSRAALPARSSASSSSSTPPGAASRPLPVATAVRFSCRRCLQRTSKAARMQQPTAAAPSTPATAATSEGWSVPETPLWALATGAAASSAGSSAPQSTAMLDAFTKSPPLDAEMPGAARKAEKKASHAGAPGLPQAPISVDRAVRTKALRHAFVGPNGTSSLKATATAVLPDNDTSSHTPTM